MKTSDDLSLVRFVGRAETWCRIFLLVILTSAMFATRSDAQQSTNGEATLQRADERQTVADLFADVSPAVVQVTASNERRKEVATGSGLVIASESPRRCIIVTNYHVIEPACELRITFASGQVAPVSAVIGEDQDTDLAILRVTSSKDDLPRRAVDLTNSATPRVGTRVIAIGNPKGLTNSLSDGLVAGYRDRAGGKKWVQITAPISPGSSGGPVFTHTGRLVGIATASIADGQNLNLAIPASDVRDLLDRDDEPRSVCKGASVQWEEDEFVRPIFENVYTDYLAKHANPVDKDRLWAFQAFPLCMLSEFQEFKAFCAGRASESDTSAVLLQAWREVRQLDGTLAPQETIDTTVNELIAACRGGSQHEVALSYFIGGSAYLDLRNNVHMSRITDLLKTDDPLGQSLYLDLFLGNPPGGAIPLYEKHAADNRVCMDMISAYHDYVAAGKAAEKLLRHSHAMNPFFAPAVEQLVFVHASVATRPEAVSWADKLVSLVPRSSSVLRLRGSIRKDLGLLADAASDLKRALDLDPYELFCSRDLAEVYLALGRYGDALNVLEPTVERNRRGPSADTIYPFLVPLLGKAYCGLGRCREAASAFRSALENAPEILKPQIQGEFEKCMRTCGG